MAKKLLSEDTVIRSVVGNSDGISVGEYRNFLYEAIGKDFIDSMDYSGFSNWLYSNTGKTLKEVVDEHNAGYKPKGMEDLLSEKRFDIISESDKAFILAFDKAINEFGYDCENQVGSGLTWGLFMIIYGKAGTKSRPCAARIYIKEDGEVILRFFLKQVDKHRQYIESASARIKDAFVFNDGDCTACSASCTQCKVYTVDGLEMRKCSHATFYFRRPTVDRLVDYMGLLAEFYPVKKVK